MTARSAAPLSLKRVLGGWDTIVTRWRLDGDECSDLLGSAPPGPVVDVASYGPLSGQRRMRLLVELDMVLCRVFPDEDHLRGWLRRPNLHLGHRTPLQAMARSPDWVRFLIDAVGVAS